MNDEVLRELVAIRSAVLIECPFVGYLLLKCEFVIDEIDAPAANDGQKRIIVNPRIFKNLSKYDKVFTLAHEALHLALLTAERRQGRDPLLWNIATDCVINFLLTNANIRPSANLWKLIVTPETIEKITSVPAEQIQQMTADQIYNLLENYRSTIELRPALCSHDEYAKYAGGADNESDDLTAYWASAVAEAQQYAKGIGKEPSGIEVFFKLLKPKINWRTLLRQAILQGPGLQVITTWRRPHRKLPNDIPGYTRLMIANVWTLVDSSGSAVGEHLDQAMTEVFSIAKSLNAKVRIIAWDADAYEESFAKVKARRTVHGSGGTKIKPALKLLLSRMRRNDIVIVLTDGMIDDIKDNEAQKMLAEAAAKAASTILVSTVMIPPLPPRWRSVLVA